MQKEFELISQRLDKIEQALSLSRKDELVTPDEFCRITGMSKNTFYQTRKTLPITPYYFGRKLRFKRADVVAWLNNTIQKKPFAFVTSK